MYYFNANYSFRFLRLKPDEKLAIWELLEPYVDCKKGESTILINLKGDYKGRLVRPLLRVHNLYPEVKCDFYWAVVLDGLDGEYVLPKYIFRIIRHFPAPINLTQITFESELEKEMKK